MRDWLTVRIGKMYQLVTSHQIWNQLIAWFGFRISRAFLVLIRQKKTNKSAELFCNGVMVDLRGGRTGRSPNTPAIQSRRAAAEMKWRRKRWREQGNMSEGGGGAGLGWGGGGVEAEREREREHERALAK